MVAQTIPAKAPPRTIAMMSNGRGQSPSTRPVAEAPTAPMYSWPSPPMFQVRIRKAKPAHSPVNSIGVAYTNVAVRAPSAVTEAEYIW